MGCKQEGEHDLEKQQGKKSWGTQRKKGSGTHSGARTLRVITRGWENRCGGGETRLERRGKKWTTTGANRWVLFEEQTRVAALGVGGGKPERPLGGGGEKGKLGR